ncbi:MULTISPECIES: MATE family efflux transporter [unclassified Aureispira]|uniref:MATE family efflux transporter n=1 Tax=unclassified Aureispira TaxID=2649989 RepID=UPI001E42B5A0|nr:MULTISPECIES: MATE family efflux transporter [unclassified Aureispira]WMX12985.1 MATE family efflux transporter [Aureispira sp. CCB-E]
MKTNISYSEIFKLSIPIMIGSAVQNLITLTDTIFLGRVGEIELGAIGLVGVFYLMIASIGYSFSKAGQIMIARRMGAQELDKIAPIYYSMLAFALSLALLLFLFMQFGGDYFFALFINNQDIYTACIAYLDYRSAGIFFSYAGVIIVALYTGVARTQVIIYNAIVLGLANMFLNYGLIFGKWGFPEMGIAGAGLASTIAEGLAFIIFIVYILLDKKNRAYGIFGRKALIRYTTILDDNTDDLPPPPPKINFQIIKAQLKLSMPIVLQSVVGMGSWFIFFIIIEDMGKTELAISNIMRAVYLLFMIPCWGFASSINTLASNLIGQNKLDEVFEVTTKTAILSFGVTMLCAASMLVAPEVVLRVGTDNVDLIQKSIRLTGVLTAILALFSIGAIYFNGLVGTGATNQALFFQIGCVIFYLAYIYIVVHLLGCSLETAWMAEFYYWIISLATSIWYLRSKRWQNIKV